MANFAFKEKTYTAEEVVRSRMTDFGAAVAADKVASVVDGLKSGYRRILWAARKLTSQTVLSQFAGNVIEVHPVGDKSITDACIRCAQEFSLGVTLIEGKGNFGSYDSDDAGAPRYTKVKLSSFAQEVFFDGVNEKTIPMKETENFMSIEPIWLIPRLPTTLLFYSMTLGSGFRTESYPRNLENVCTLVEMLVESRSQGIPLDMNKVAPLLIPDFPIANVIRNSGQVQQQYAAGNFKVPLSVDGLVDIDGNEITLKTSAYSLPFPRVFDSLKAMLDDKNSWIHNVANQCENLGNRSYEGRIVVTVKRTANPFDVAIRLIKDLGINRVMRERPTFVTRSGGLVEKTPLELLNIWYNIRRESIVSGVRYDQINVSRQILEKEVSLLVADRWDEVERIVRDKSNNYDQVIEKLMDRFELSRMRAKILANTPIINANAMTRDSVYEEIEALRKKALIIKSRLDTAQDVIYRDAEQFKKKYRKPRRTRIDPYMGYILVKGCDIHQFADLDECKRLLKSFPGSLAFMYYDVKKLAPKMYAVDGVPSRTVEHVLPRILHATRIYQIPTTGHTYSVCITDETASIANSVMEPKEGVSYIVGDRFCGIFVDGTVEQMTSKSLTKRRGEGKRGARSDLAFVIPSQIGDCVVAYMNKLDNATLFLSKIDANTTKIPLSLMDKTEFLEIIPLKSKTPWILNLPEWANGSYTHAIVNDISATMDGKATLAVKLGRKMEKDYDLNSAITI